MGRYVRYYNEAGKHLSLDENAPARRLTDPPEVASIRSRPHCDGQHHEYLRPAAFTRYEPTDMLTCVSAGGEHVSAQNIANRD